MIPVKLGPPKKGNKNHAVRTEVDGHKFDSGAEARRHGQLAMLQRAGMISKLTIHPEFKIKLNDVEICKVELDFSYRDEKSGLMVIEDVKGADDSTSRLKRKLVQAAHDIKVVIVRMPRARKRT
mgnify:CR=1 FL=1